MPGMGKHSPIEAAADSAAPRRNHRWLLFAIAIPAAVEVWACWVGLGSLCGFPMLGRFSTDWTLAVGMEAYGGYALYVWLGGAPGPRSRSFAQWSALGAFALSLVGQVAYHLMLAKHITRPPSIVVVFVACLPVVVLALAAILTHLMHADTKTREQVAREAAERAAAKVAAKSGNTTLRPAVTSPAEAPAARGAVPVTASVTPEAEPPAGEGSRKRTDEEWLAEVRNLHAEQGDALSVRKLMPQLKLLGGGKGIAIGKATEMLAQVKAEARAAAGADDAAGAVG